VLETRINQFNQYLDFLYSARHDVIDDGFELNVAMNEIGYRYPDSRSRRLFWSLPSIFTGNKVKSYGGNLTLTQHITAYPGAQSYKDQDILLIGNGITLFWTNPTELQPDIPLVCTTIYLIFYSFVIWDRKID
jgi:hypothetical protein